MPQKTEIQKGCSDEVLYALVQNGPLLYGGAVIGNTYTYTGETDIMLFFGRTIQ